MKQVLKLAFLGIIVICSLFIISKAVGFLDELGKEVSQTIAENIPGKEEIKKTYKELGLEVADFLKNKTVSAIKSEINANNPNKDSKAAIVVNPTLIKSLSQREKEFKFSRAPFVTKGFEKFFEQPIPMQKQFNIAFSGSGGGYRAMILTLGYLLGFEKLGLYDTFLYSSSLSGSTWLQAPFIMWLASKGQLSAASTLEQYKDFLLQKIKNGRFELTGMRQELVTSGLPTFVNDIIWPKLVFNLPVSSIDIFGALLGRIFFSTFPGGALRQYLPAQWDVVKNGAVPFPIYTSISMHKSEDNNYIYNWYEFNPIDIRNLDLGFYFPSYAFGWQFDKGSSVESAPLASLSYLMGIWGSAYSVNIADLYALMSAKLKVPQQGIDKIKATATILALDLLGKEKVGKLRFSPAQVNNPFKGMEDEVGEWLAKKDYLVFVDGGIKYNIPLRPLLRPERNINVIFIGESSGNVPSNSELVKALDDARRVYGYNYSRDDDRSTDVVQIYKDMSVTDPNKKKGPYLVYINFFKDEKLIDKVVATNTHAAQLVQQYNLRKFDAARCLAEGFCGTFNLGKHNEAEFLQLLHMAMFNVLASHEIVKKYLEKEFKITPKKETPAQEQAEEEQFWF